MNQMNETAIAVDVKRAFAAKVARGMFQPVARHLRSDIAEDRLAEGIAMTFELYARNATQGRILPDAVLVHACHLRAIDTSRRVAGAGGGQPKRDVFDERNYTAGKVEVLRFDAPLEDMEGQSCLGFDEPGTPHPARRLASAMDLESWLSSLDAQDRLLLAPASGRPHADGDGGGSRPVHHLGARPALRAGIRVGPAREGRCRRSGVASAPVEPQRGAGLSDLERSAVLSA
jgi:hypothetical protein